MKAWGHVRLLDLTTLPVSTPCSFKGKNPIHYIHTELPADFGFSLSLLFTSLLDTLRDSNALV